MPGEPALPGSEEAGPAFCLQLRIPADTLAVREALVRICDALLQRGEREEDLGTVQIVLAEVLNNIVEHAYAGQEAGAEIEIALSRAPEGLWCHVVDQGRQMPGDSLPEGNLPPFSADDLPEGGFGWHLIRLLSQDLAYRRSEGRNHLTFRLGGLPPQEQSA